MTAFKVVALPTHLTEMAIANCKADVIRLHGLLWEVCDEMTAILDLDMAESKKYRSDQITRKQYMIFLEQIESKKAALLKRRDAINCQIDQIKQKLQHNWGVVYD